MHNPTPYFPYPRPPNGPLRQLDCYLQDGGITGSDAENLRQEGLPWSFIAPYVHDLEWWRQQKPAQAPQPAKNWRAQTWGAAICLEVNGLSIWIDPGPLAPTPKAAPDLILVTHAHHDHTARLPAWSALFPDTRILMSTQTADLLANHAEHNYLLQACLQRTILLDFGEVRKIQDVEVCMLPAGHLLGASMIEIKAGQERVLITGDFALREVGGLKGADIPGGEYSLVFMASSGGVSDWFPPVDVRAARTQFLNAVAEAYSCGAQQIIVPIQSLGQAQEAYAALVMTQRAGGVPNLVVYLKDSVATISDQYRRALNTTSDPWRLPFAEAHDPLPAKGIIIMPEGNIDSISSLNKKPKSVHLSKPAIYTHAGLGEQLAFAVGVCCADLVIYHGYNTLLERTLLDLGRKIIIPRMEN